MNISGRKSGTPPSRPPPPKSGGMSFSFKALEEENDEDEELTTYTGKFDKQVSEEKIKQARLIDKERVAVLLKPPEIPARPEVVRAKSPAVKAQTSIDKLLDIKEKIQDTITKKKEELLNDSVSTSPKDKEPKVVAAENLKSADSELFLSLEEPGNEPFDFNEKFYEADNESDKKVEEVTDEKPGTPEENVGDVVDDDDEQLEISEEYFNPNGEDFLDLPGVQPMLRQRKRLQKFRKIKPIVPPAPVALSKINDKTTLEKKLSPDRTEAAVGTVRNDNDSESKVSETKEPKLHGAIIPVKKILGAAVILFLYLVIPLPSYLSGLIAGLILSSGGWMLYLWVTQQPPPRPLLPEDPALEELPPLIAPEMRDPKGEDGCYKGWMNEIMEYQPDTYSINHTHSIYVHLEGTTLRLRRPKVNIPKRAMWDDPKVNNSQFIHQRHFDIEGSRILLLPPGLVKKRLWSKKYPICVALAKTRPKLPRVDSAPVTAVVNNDLKMTNSNSAEPVHGFEMVDNEKCDSSVLYLFARTCQQKEQWYHRLSGAAKGVPLKNHILEIRRLVEDSSKPRRSSSSDSLRHKRQNSSDSLSSITTTSSVAEDSVAELRDFVKYMARLIPKDQTSSPSSPTHNSTQSPNSSKDKDKDTKSSESRSSMPGSGSKGIVCDAALLPMNALLGRCFFDFLGNQRWANKVQEKLQKKLSKIHIPYFIEELKISEISLGSEIPVIRRANKPYLDENGFWIDLDITYSGKFNMTIETKVNLLKLKHTPPPTSSTSLENKTESKRSAVTDSGEEDSAESSTDEDEDTTSVADDGTSQSGGTGKKILKYINKITASKYFQSATENKYIKKAMTEVSNTRLILTVELQKLSGTLAINIPSPPSDRLWYGFRGNPQLWLVAKPKVGEREVTMSHITEWIEKKLALEFQHVLVMPNMDDLVIPILSPGSELEAVTEMSPLAGTEL